MSDDLPESKDVPNDDSFSSQFFVDPTRTVIVRFAGASDIGRVRKNNEDHFAVLHRYRSQNLLSTNLPRENFAAIRDEAYLFIVTDGLGGAAAGELASRIVMEEAWELSGQASSWVMKFQNLSAVQFQERMNAYAKRIQMKLMQIAQENPKTKGMATTWTSAYVTGWDAVITHIGDSRAYVYRDRELRQLTHDQTLAQAFEDVGIAQSETSQYRHILMNALDSCGTDAVPTVEHISLQDADRLLLCTDGLSDFVPADEIAKVLETVEDPRNACNALIAQAEECGGRDNATVVLADFSQAD